MPRMPLALLFLVLSSLAPASWAASASADPLAAVDLHRAAIVSDVVEGFRAEVSAANPGREAESVAELQARLAGLRADRLLAASLASSLGALRSILNESEGARSAALSRLQQKTLGDAAADLVYTPLTPCRLIDTRGFGAPIQGGAYAPNERRAYTPNGLCALPMTGVNSIMVSFTTQNLTPNSGGYLAILAPAAPVTATVDVFNLGSAWSASNTVVATGSAAQFDVFVSTANAEVVVDVLGYFRAPQGGAVISITAGAGLTGGTITTSGTLGLAATNLLPTTACATNQIAKWNGTAWLCAFDSLTGTVQVANGGTGQATLAANGIVYGQGTAAVGTAVGSSGQVLTGTAGAPAWTGSPSISGNLTLVNSTASLGNITKAGTRFIHNYGTENTFIGVNAGNFTMTGPGNTASGQAALASNTTGSYNVASGVRALLNNTTGSSNVASGLQALVNNTTGSSNVASGADALFDNTTGSSNVANGFQALTFNTTGSGNTASGISALRNNTIGNNNIAIGNDAGTLLTTGSNNIAIGHQGAAAEANTIRIGTAGTQTRAFIAGIRGVTTGGAAIAVLVDTNGQLGTTSSSRRVKDDIADMDAASAALMKLRPVTFHYKSDRNPSGRTLQYGLIAEEVAAVYPGLVAHAADGEVETVMYQYLPAMLLNEHQKQQRRIEAQTMRIAELERERLMQMARMDALEKQALEITALKRQAAIMSAALDRLERTGMSTAALGLK